MESNFKKEIEEALTNGNGKLVKEISDLLLQTNINDALFHEKT